MQIVNFYNLRTKNLSALAVKAWVVKLANHYEVQIDNFAVNFINKEQMLEMNQRYLNHDTHTDILTFDYGNQQFINAELFVSEHMCVLNAEENDQTTEDEMLRLISHGFLHTLGYSDKKQDQKILMTEQEDFCLSMFHVKQ